MEALDTLMVTDAQPVRALKDLTPREMQILHLLSDGRTTEEAACLLSISLKTAESHRTRLYRKLEAKNAPHAVRIAIRRGLIEA